MFMYRKNKVWQKFLRGSGGDHPPRRGLGQRPKVFFLTLILTFLPTKGGQGRSPKILIFLHLIFYFVSAS
ncbi:MAG: hypothetical protein HW380_2145 [Magnetococcales bacterium]|nr:hypothetical protein [Magnetococcales bacterium]